MPSIRSRMDSRPGLTGIRPPAGVAVRRERAGRDGDLRRATGSSPYTVRADSTPGMARSLASTSGEIGASVSMSV